jgi:uncharacterized membrane protein YhfC
MKSDTEFDFVFATIASIAGMAIGIGCIVVGTSYWDMSWKMLPIAAVILFFSIRVLSDYPKELLVRIRGDINERQEVIVELIMWLVVITISVCIRMFP